MEDSRILDAVGSLYDCIPDPDHWQKTLGDLAEMTDSELVTLAVLDTAKQVSRFSAAYGDPAVLEALFNTYAAHMPFYHVLHRLDLEVPLDFDELCKLHGPDGFDVWYDSRIYQEWARPNQLRMGANLLVMKRDHLVGAFNTLTTVDRPATSATMKLVSTLAPHIRRAVTISDLLETERRKADTFQDVVDNLSCPVLVVAKDMRILYANSTAEALLRDEMSMRQIDGRLVLAYAQAHASVSHAVELGHREEFQLGSAGIDVPLVRVERPAVAHVLPLARRLSHARTMERAAAAIFVAAPGTNPLPAIEAIAALFGLTVAEKKVAALVAEGRTRGEIALANGVSEHTIKAQLGLIYDKTSTGDQRQLQLLIRELTPPVSSKRAKATKPRAPLQQ